MSFSDDYSIRDASVVTLDYIGDCIDALFSSSGPLAWTQWNPTWGITGGGSWGAGADNPATADACYYSQVGDLTLCRIYGLGVSSSTVTTITITLPSTPTYAIYAAGVIIDGGANKNAILTSSGATLTVVEYDGSGITGGANTGVGALFFYCKA